MRTAAMCARALLIGGGLGCLGGTGEGNPMVRDSAGVQIAENPESRATGSWTLADAPQLDLGGSTTDATQQFYRVESSTRLPDGRIVVANGGTQEVRFYDGQGRFLATSGREGGGPGEFQGLTWVSVYRGDSLLTYDRRLLRLSVFDWAGRFVRNVSLRDDQGRTLVNAVGAFPDGTILVVAETLDAALGVGIFRPTWNLFVFSPDGELRDSVGSHPGPESYLHAFRAGGVMDAPRPFGRTTELAVWGERFYAGETGTFEIRIHAKTGQILSIVRRAHSFREISREDVALVRDRNLERVQHIPHLRSNLTEFFEAVPIPATMPAFDSFLVDHVGNLWVREYQRPADDRERWSVFGADGRLADTVAMPERFDAQDIGDRFVLGRWRDSNGVEHIRLYELRKG